MMKITIMIACLVFPIAAANSSLKWENVNKQRREKEVYLFATGYYHPEKDQDLYATGSYEKDLELNGRGITASGEKVSRGHVAVDPSFIPLGTEFYRRTWNA